MSEVPGPEGHTGYGPFDGGGGRPVEPVSGAPAAAVPVSGPVAPDPVSPPPAGMGHQGYNPVSGPPAQPAAGHSATAGAGGAYQVRPSSGPPAGGSFGDMGLAPSWQPRIVPTPKPSRRQTVIAALAGLLCGLLVFGTGGFFTGYAAAPEPAPPKPKPSPGTSLHEFEQAQLALNRPKFPSELMPIAGSWLPWINTCARSGEPGGPNAGTGEAVRVSCHYANASIFFIQYRSADDREKAYANYLGENIDAKQLAPGVAEPGTRKTASGTADGHYVEFAFHGSADANARTVSGLWWSDADAPIGAYIIVYWADGLGSSWQPLRDVWSRYG